MSEIDWDLAPKDATHGRATTVGFDFYKRLDGYWVYMNRSGRWETAIFINENAYVERPQAWACEAVPPVGTICEYKHVHEWQRVEVFAVKPNHNGSETALFTYENGTWCGCAEPSFFRPIRTQEQIAAEERETELNRMVATVSMLDKGWARKVCAGLYDAGYRKFEITDDSDPA